MHKEVAGNNETQTRETAKTMKPSDILEVVQSVTDLPVFYAEDAGRFWLEAEQTELPAVGLYAATGLETSDAFGILYPKVELHIITDGGAFNDNTAPSREVADGRNILTAVQRALRPYVIRIPNQAGFARKDSVYTNWCTLEFRDPLTRCR